MVGRLEANYRWKAEVEMVVPEYGTSPPKLEEAV
jgi:hypothetical protein